MRSLVWTAAVAIIVTASGSIAGQRTIRPAPAVAMLAERARLRLGRNPVAVLDRILSFDANGDNRIARDELPERMENLVSRGDRNDDGFLAPEEIIPLIDLQASAPQRPPNVRVRGSMTLADIITDLKLPPATHSRALAIVTGPRSVDNPASDDFKTEIKDLLDGEDFENYAAAAARRRSTPRIIGGNIGGVARDPAGPVR